MKKLLTATSLNKELDNNVGHTQDPYRASRESEEKQRLLSIIDSKLDIEFNLADIRQDPSRYI